MIRHTQQELYRRMTGVLTTILSADPKAPVDAGLILSHINDLTRDELKVMIYTFGQMVVLVHQQAGEHPDTYGQDLAEFVRDFAAYNELSPPNQGR